MSELSRGVAPRRRPTVAARERERRNRKLADREIARSRDFFQATLDSLVASVAVLLSERKAREESVHHDIEELASIKQIQDALAEERLLLAASPSSSDSPSTT